MNWKTLTMFLDTQMNDCYRLNKIKMNNYGTPSPSLALSLETDASVLAIFNASPPL